MPLLSSRWRPENSKQHQRLVRDLRGGVAFPMAREAKPLTTQDMHYDRENRSYLQKDGNAAMPMSPAAPLAPAASVSGWE
jgi:hypothetical protein